MSKALLNLPVHVLIVNKDNTDNTSWTNSNVRFLTCSCTSYISRVFSYCLCLAAWKAVGPLDYTLISLQVSLVRAWVSYPSPDSAAAAVAAPVLAVAGAAATELTAVAAVVEALGTPCCVLLAVVVVVAVVLLVLDGLHCLRWESGLG